jgi:hypothetical protein
MNLSSSLTRSVCLLAAVAALAMPISAGAFPRGLDFGGDADRVVVTPSVSTGRLSGETLYRINGDFFIPGQGSGTVDFTVSELEFPLDVSTASAGLAVAFPGRLLLRLGLAKNITSDAGTMKDSDWGAWYLEYGAPFSEETLDIYSESRAELDAVIFQGDALYRLLGTSTVTLAAGVGYRYQNFRYDLSDLDQWYPSFRYYTGQDAGHDRVAGKVGTYEVSYRVLMIEGAVEVRPWRDVSIRCLVAVAPFVKARDEDDHLLRGKRSVGDGTGLGGLVDLGVEYRLPAGFFAALSYEYLHMTASGTQTQTWYRTTDEANAGDWLTIDQEIESTQHALDLTLGVRF